MIPRLATTLLLAATATAHFSINSPPQKKPSNEAQLESGPCGGAKLDFKSDDVSDFHVDGDAVAVTGTHPQSNWLLRATTDKTGEGNWTQIFPIVEQSGIGRMCQPVVTVPEDWEGEEGLIGVVANAEDGILFGCAQVKFVSGSADAPKDCKNSTDQISFTSDSDLEDLLGDNAGPEADESTDDDDGDDDSAVAGLRAGLFGVGFAAVAALVL